MKKLLGFLKVSDTRFSVKNVTCLQLRVKRCELQNNWDEEVL